MPQSMPAKRRAEGLPAGRDAEGNNRWQANRGKKQRTLVSVSVVDDLHGRPPPVGLDLVIRALKTSRARAGAVPDEGLLASQAARFVKFPRQRADQGRVTRRAHHVAEAASSEQQQQHHPPRVAPAVGRHDAGASAECPLSGGHAGEPRPSDHQQKRGKGAVKSAAKSRDPTRGDRERPRRRRAPRRPPGERCPVAAGSNYEGNLATV